MRKVLLILTGFLLMACKADGYKEQPAEEMEITPEVKESIARGASLYNNFCATCHMASGQGIANAFPPLNNSDWLQKKRKESISAVKHGLNGPTKVNGENYDSVMTDLGLTDQEVADVMNYIFTAWDNNIGPQVTVEEVEGI